MNDEEFRNAVKLAVDLIVEERKKKGFIEQLAGITAFVAALAALATSLVAISTALDTKETQTKIEEAQRLLVKNQERIDENTRLSRLYNTENFSCSHIALDEEKKWETLESCLKEDQILDDESDDKKRLECARKVTTCKIVED